MMKCRPRCGACCIAPSISSPLPGLPDGKPAGQKCVHLDETFACVLWGTSAYPEVCKKFQPEFWVCGESQNDALFRITELERATSPEPAI